MLISKFGAINKEKIVDFENKYKITIPEQYRIFLERYNGGETPNTNFSINGISSDIRTFFGIGDVKCSIDNVEIITIEDKKLLPIADDSFGNYILIDLHDGSIAFYDHEIGKISFITADLIGFCNICESKAISSGATKSVEEREKDLIARGRGSIITEALRDMWRAEIKKYESIIQEEVNIS